MAVDLDVEKWSSADSADLYEVARWGNGYFSVGPGGHLLVHPDKNPTKSIDLKQLVDRLQLRGIDLPILLRFGGILQHRLGEINSAFGSAMKENNYRGDYCCVYPVKVNESSLRSSCRSGKKCCSLASPTTLGLKQAASRSYWL